MKTIEIAGVDNQKAVFTTRSVSIDGADFTYSLIDAIEHDADRRTYSVSEGERSASFEYTDKDAKALNTLFLRIAQLRNLNITEMEDAESHSSSDEKVSVLQRPSFLITEAAVALALLTFGICLLFIAF